MVDLTDDEKRLARKLRDDFPFYARKCLKIKDKQGRMVPFELNRAQQFIHEKLEDQKRRTGKVRALILKGRQEGATTYIEGRYFHGVAWFFDVAVGTLSHLAATTDKLHEILKRFLDHLPEKLRPSTPVNNSRKIKFADIGGVWELGTAGTDEVGRGGTLQKFHGSEVAFWARADKLRSGIMQSVADLPGTEIILESTANGLDGFFYPMCMDAIEHVGDYELIFVPWFWMQEYRRPVPPGFELSEEEEKLKAAYELDDEQICWRRNKIIELGGVHEFRKEYPCNPQEAFQTSGDSFISSEKMLLARKNRIDKADYQYAPLTMGVDPARTRDRFVIAFRKGRKLLKVFVYSPKAKQSWVSPCGRVVVEPLKDINDPLMAEIVGNMLTKYEPAFCAVDVGNGWGMVDILRKAGHQDVVRPVLFGEAASEPTVYANKRAELWDRLKDWAEGVDGSADIPDVDMIQTDFCCMPKPLDTGNSRKLMPKKSEIIKKYGLSPDIAEAVALTLAFLIKAPHSPKQTIKKKNAETSGVRTLKKKRAGGSSGDFSSGNIFARGDKT